MSLPQSKLTPQQYLEIERKAERKSEFYDGEMFAMAGASDYHEAIKTNISTELRNQLKGRGCRVYTSDMRVKVTATGLYTYPDVVVVCGERRFEDNHGDTLLNPSTVIEVLSPTTEAYDRGGKFASYRAVQTIIDYVLVAQATISVEHFARQTDGSWRLQAYTSLDDVFKLSGVEAQLALADMYAEIVFPKPQTAD